MSIGSIDLAPMEVLLAPYESIEKTAKKKSGGLTIFGTGKGITEFMVLGVGDGVKVKGLSRVFMPYGTLGSLTKLETQHGDMYIGSVRKLLLKAI